MRAAGLPSGSGLWPECQLFSAPMVLSVRNASLAAEGTLKDSVLRSAVCGIRSSCSPVPWQPISINLKKMELKSPVALLLVNDTVTLYLLK